MYDGSRDESNFMLTLKQCDAAFPSVYEDIDRGAAYSMKTGKVAPEDINLSWKEHGAVKAMVFNQQLRSHYTSKQHAVI